MERGVAMVCCVRRVEMLCGAAECMRQGRPGSSRAQGLEMHMCVAASPGLSHSDLSHVSQSTLIDTGEGRGGACL